MPATTRKNFSTYHTAIFIVLLCVTFLCLMPLIYIVALSFSSKSAAAAGLVTFYPVDFTTFSYGYILKDYRFFTAFGVSVERVILGGLINFVLTVTMAYPLAKEGREFRARTFYMWFILFAMMFNGGLIPWYIVVKTLHLTNSIWALVLPGAVPVFNVVLLMNFYRGLPKEIGEAAIMDGAGPWKSLLYLYIPLSKPAIATVTLFSIVGHWNAFFDGMILVNKQSLIPLQTYIQQLVVAPVQNSADRPEELAKLSVRTFNAAKIVVTMLPILLIYPFLQKYFVTGLTLGSVKE